MHFISEDLEDYVANHSQAEPELLAKLNKEDVGGLRGMGSKAQDEIEEKLAEMGLR